MAERDVCGGHQCETEKIHRDFAAQPEWPNGRPGNAEYPERAAGQPLLVEQDQKNQNGEPKRRHRQIDAAQAGDRHQHQARHRRQQPRGDKRERKRHAEILGQEARGIGADPEKRRLSHRQLARKADQQLHAERCRGGDHRQTKNVQQIVLMIDERDQGQGEQRDAVADTGLRFAGSERRSSHLSAAP
jgi:hypothetical protein